MQIKDTQIFLEKIGRLHESKNNSGRLKEILKFRNKFKCPAHVLFSVHHWISPPSMKEEKLLIESDFKVNAIRNRVARPSGRALALQREVPGFVFGQPIFINSAVRE